MHGRATIQADGKLACTGKKKRKRDREPVGRGICSRQSLFSCWTFSCCQSRMFALPRHIESTILSESTNKPSMDSCKDEMKRGRASKQSAFALVQQWFSKEKLGTTLKKSLACRVHSGRCAARRPRCFNRTAVVLLHDRNPSCRAKGRTCRPKTSRPEATVRLHGRSASRSFLSSLAPRLFHREAQSLLLVERLLFDIPRFRSRGQTCLTTSRGPYIAVLSAHKLLG